MRRSFNLAAPDRSGSYPTKHAGCTGRHPVESQFKEERGLHRRVVIGLGRPGARLELVLVHQPDRNGIQWMGFCSGAADDRECDYLSALETWLRRPYVDHTSKDAE